jgi:hypothetical protein
VAGSYELWLTDDRGVRIAQLDNILWFSATRHISRTATFVGGLPTSFDTNLLQPDRMIQVWRAPEGGRLSLWRAYFVRKWRFETRGAQQTLTVTGVGPNDLLRRRIVAAFSASAQAAKTDFADDMMKEIVTEALADGVVPVPTAGTRVWADLSVAADLSNGPTLTKAFPFDRLLLPSGGGAIASIAKASREAGTEVFFDIVTNTVSSSSITFQFRTYTGQPGQDVSDRVVFDQERGNLQNPFLEFDYTQEANYIYGAGQGIGAARAIQQVSDAARYNASQWNRCEEFADARNQAAANGVREAARAVLEAGRPRRRFGGTPISTAGTRFGVDWNFGDRVTARYRGQEFIMIIRTVAVSVDDRGRERIDSRLDFED